MNNSTFMLRMMEGEYVPFSSELALAVRNRCVRDQSSRTNVQAALMEATTFGKSILPESKPFIELVGPLEGGLRSEGGSQVTKIRHLIFEGAQPSPECRNQCPCITKTRIGALSVAICHATVLMVP